MHMRSAPLHLSLILSKGNYSKNCKYILEVVAQIGALIQICPPLVFE